MEEEIKVQIQGELVKEIDKISREYYITRDEWLRMVLKSAIRQEFVREKILDIVASEYEKNKITFMDMANLVGYLNAKKVKSVVEGAKKSFIEAKKLARE